MLNVNFLAKGFICKELELFFCCNQVLTWKAVSPLDTYFCCLEVRVTCYSFRMNVYENVMHVISFVKKTLMNENIIFLQCLWIIWMVVLYFHFEGVIHHGSQEFLGATPSSPSCHAMWLPWVLFTTFDCDETTIQEDSTRVPLLHFARLAESQVVVFPRCRWWSIHDSMAHSVPLL